jgi:S1-C subfamily serine protease
VTLTLAATPIKGKSSAEPSSRQKSAPVEKGEPRLGVAVTELTQEIAQLLELPGNVKGVVIADIEPGSVAAEVGLQIGDVVRQVNRKAVHNVGEFRSQLGLRGSAPVLLQVNREGHNLFFAMHPR